MQLRSSQALLETKIPKIYSAAGSFIFVGEKVTLLIRKDSDKSELSTECSYLVSTYEPKLDDSVLCQVHISVKFPNGGLTQQN